MKHFSKFFPLMLVLMACLVNPAHAQTIRSTWMAYMQDNRPLSEIVIPGTHDSGAYVIPTDIGETQDWNITQQLENGVRFLDVRIANSDFGAYPFEIRHGFERLGNFHDLVLNPVNNFLAAHPSEVVLMSVSDEDTLDKIRFLNEVIYAPGSRFVTNANSATALGNVRGKIVLFNRMGRSEGIAWNSLQPYIQDNYNLDNNCGWVWYWPFYDCSIDYPKKAHQVLDFLNAARTDSGYHLWVNFASANWQGMYIGNSAEVVNANIKNYFYILNYQIFNGAAINSFGSIIPMDYPNRQGDEPINAMLIFNLVANYRGGLMTKTDCAQEPVTRSGSGGATTVTWINNSQEVRRGYWLNYSGQRVLYWELQPGQQVQQQTYITHPWVITNANNQCVSILTANSGPLLRGYLQ